MKAMHADHTSSHIKNISHFGHWLSYGNRPFSTYLPLKPFISVSCIQQVINHYIENSDNNRFYFVFLHVHILKYHYV